MKYLPNRAKIKNCKWKLKILLESKQFLTYHYFHTLFGFTIIESVLNNTLSYYAILLYGSLLQDLRSRLFIMNVWLVWNGCKNRGG